MKGKKRGQTRLKRANHSTRTVIQKKECPKYKKIKVIEVGQEGQEDMKKEQ